MRNYEMLVNHIHQLIDWGFKTVKGPNGTDHQLTHDDLIVKFNVDTNTGAYLIDGELTLIYEWDELENLMEQIL